MKIRKLRVAALMTATACATMMMLAACGEKPVEHTHTLQQVAAVAATCTTAGTEAYYKCTDPECGKLFSDDKGETEITAAKVVPAKGHNMTKHEAVTATCIGEGTVEYYTCANEAADVYYADNQGAQKLKTISTPKTNHQLVAVPEKAATCAAAGTEAYWNCLTCQHKFSDDKGEHEIDAPIEIPKSQEHGALVLKMTQDAIPDPVAEGGSLERVCSVCGQSAEAISYIGGFKDIAEQPTKYAELTQDGTYYATTYSHFTPSAYGDADEGDGTWIYTEAAFVAFKITQAGTYTLNFTDLLVQEGRTRVLNYLAIGTAYAFIPDPFSWGIFAGATSPIPTGQLELVTINYNQWESGEKKQFDSITFTATQEQLSAQGGTLCIQVGIQYYALTGEGTDLALQANCVVPFLIKLSKTFA